MFICLWLLIRNKKKKMKIIMSECEKKNGCHIFISMNYVHLSMDKGKKKRKKLTLDEHQL